VDRAVARAMKSDGRRAGEETEEERAEIAEHLELSPKQFAAVMQVGGVPLTKSETRILVTMFDRDGNGKISREEFLAFTGFGNRPKTRGDVNEILRGGNLCAWEACDHVTGMANAFQVQPDSAGLLDAASSSAAKGRRKGKQKKKKQRQRSNQKSESAEDEDDGYDDAFDSEGGGMSGYDEGDGARYSDDDEFKVNDNSDVGMIGRAALVEACRPVLTRNGSAKPGWVRYPLPDLIKRQRKLLAQGLRIPRDMDKTPPPSCQQTLWSNAQRAEAVKQLKQLARSNRELKDTVTRVTCGDPPAPPVLFAGSCAKLPFHSGEEEDSYDNDQDHDQTDGRTPELPRETSLVIRWAPGNISSSASGSQGELCYLLVWLSYACLCPSPKSCCRLRVN
jgi:hypothetical protein